MFVKSFYFCALKLQHLNQSLKEICPNGLAPMSSTTAQLVIGDLLTIGVMEKLKFGAEDFAKFHPGGALGKNLLYLVDDFLVDKSSPKVDLMDNISEVILSISSCKYGITAVFENEKLVGVITDGDLRRMLLKHEDYRSLKAKDIMSENPKTIESSLKAKEALALMKKHNIGQVLVLERGLYKGILDVHTLIREGISI
ncbi:MAG: hypothetical protein C4K58_08060 [Flavobacteriaceae bacterium]|nr:MAG: hypothetical protein C4K58_08060 [Flavobacteriaceae bacterium]